MRPSHLHISVASGARAPAKLLLPLLMAQLWGEARDRAWGEVPDRGRWEGDLSAPTPSAAFAPLGPRHSLPTESKPRPCLEQSPPLLPAPRPRLQQAPPPPAAARPRHARAGLAPPPPRPFLLHRLRLIPAFYRCPFAPRGALSPYLLRTCLAPRSVPGPCRPAASRSCSLHTLFLL